MSRNEPEVVQVASQGMAKGHVVVTGQVALEGAELSNKQISKPNGSARRRKPQSKMGIWALLPFTIFGLVLAIYPMAQVIRMSFSNVRIEHGGFVWEANGFSNLRAVLSSGLTWQVFANTIVFIVATVILTIIFGLIMAILVDRAVMMLPLARNVLIWPAVVAPVIVSLMWLLILSPTAGGLNKLLNTIGLPTQGWLASKGGAMMSIIIVDVWHWTPVVFLFLYTALKAIDASTLEAARIDGAGEGRIFWSVILPLLTPAIGAVSVIRVVMGVKAFDEMYLLTRGGPDYATTLVSHHVKTLFFDTLKLGPGSAFSLVVVVVVALALGIFLFIRSRKETQS
ncbi:MAG: carbohydrate ABC transporter permease [Canibacter sp.]